jgi:hypothetical protein
MVEKEFAVTASFGSGYARLGFLTGGGRSQNDSPGKGVDPINPSIYRGVFAPPPTGANRFNGFFPPLQIMGAKSFLK